MLYTKVQTPSVRLVVDLVRTFVQYAHNKSNQWSLSLAVLACVEDTARQSSGVFKTVYKLQCSMTETTHFPGFMFPQVVKRH